VQLGSISDGASGTLSHPFNRDWAMSVMGTYTHSSGLIRSPLANQLLGISQTYNSVFAGVQATRRLTGHTSVYFGYTVTSQTASGNGVTTSPNVFSGTGNIFSVGISWAPRSTTVGQLF
jgi:hypothetical protein